MNDAKHLNSKWLVATLFILLCVKTIAVATFPVTYDEAYYYFWSLRPQLGYFDHPPLIAYLISLPEFVFPEIFRGHPLIALRLGVYSLHLISLFYLYKWFQDILPDKSIRFDAMVIALFSLASLVMGVLATPDIVSISLWILACYAAQRAISRSAANWLAAGVFAGLAFNAKYSLAIIGAVFIWAFALQVRRQQPAPINISQFKWPLLGGLLCFCLVGVNLAWNSKNDYITINFQLRHGVDAKRSAMIESKIPPAQRPSADSLDYQLSQRLQEEFSKSPHPIAAFFKQIAKLPPLSWVIHFVNYVLAQILLFGAIGLGFILLLIRHPRSRGRALWEYGSALAKSKGSETLIPALLVPIVFFGGFSLFTKVEANWSAMVFIAAAPFIASLMPLHKTATKILMGINFILFSLLIWHAQSPIIKPNIKDGITAKADRVLSETYGFDWLSQYAKQKLSSEETAGSGIKPIIYVDKYQTASMINFYLRGIYAFQYPGVTRDSEYIRMQNALDTDKLLPPRFVYIGQSLPIPAIPGYKRNAPIFKLSACLDKQTLISDKVELLAGQQQSPCRFPINQWFSTEFSRNINDALGNNN